MVMEEQESDMELASERTPVPQVQKPTEVPSPHNTNKVTSVPRIKPRLRKKALHAAILKQMEFYFGDANLNKDRFLAGLLKKDPYIDIGIFTRFNKIRELTTDVSRIRKAIQSSSMLSISQDGTKVCRITPVNIKENIDECTIYVQNLPPDADHEWLSSVFSEYGVIDYVSIPRYKNNKKIKGFAFIEFNSPNGVTKCIKALQKKGCVLPSHTSPDELLSITTFDDAEKDVTLESKLSMEKQNNTDIKEANSKDETDQVNSTIGNTDILKNENGKKNTLNEISDSEQAYIENEGKKKRKHRDNENSETICTDSSTVKEQSDVDVQKCKKKKVKHFKDACNNHKSTENEQDHKSFEPKQENNENVECTESNQNLQSKDVEMIDDHVNRDKEVSNTDKKKKRKRKRKNRIDDISCTMGLQVLSKKDWKHLRNKYLELQRSKMKQLKQHLRKKKWNQLANYDKIKHVKEENEERDNIFSTENNVIRSFNFTPGVIIKIEMNEPCTDPKNFKMELKGINGVRYIDVSEGSYQAYVRCDNTETAHLFAQRSNDEKCMTILQGEEEQMYWKKILHDREEKLSNNVRVKQRGRDKLLKKAEKELGKHIKFDED